MDSVPEKNLFLIPCKYILVKTINLYLPHILKKVYIYIYISYRKFRHKNGISGAEELLCAIFSYSM